MSTAIQAKPRGSELRIWWGFYAFLLGGATAVDINLGPTLLAADVLILASFPVAVYSWTRSPRRISRKLWIVIGLALLWLGASVASNIANSTTLFNWIRGIALIAVFITALFVMAVFVAGRWNRERLYMGGLVVGLVAEHFIAPTFPLFREAWKYELGIPLSIALAIWLDRRVRRGTDWLLIESCLLLALGLFSLVQGYRTLSAFLVFTGFVGCYKWAVRLTVAQRAIRRVPQPLNFVKTAKVLVVAACAIVAVVSLYTAAVDKGWMGHKGTQRVEQSQAQGLGPVLDTLVGSRPQILISGYAITQKPLLGFGSWPQRCDYLSLLKGRERELGISEPVGLGFTYRDTRTPCLIPTHSHIIGAWVWSGVLGVPVWLFVWGLVGWWLACALGDRDYLELAPIIMAIDLLWAIPFSPFAGSDRITEALFIAIILSRLSKVGQKHESVYRNDFV